MFSVAAVKLSPDPSIYFNATFLDAYPFSILAVSWVL